MNKHIYAINQVFYLDNCTNINVQDWRLIPNIAHVVRMVIRILMVNTTCMIQLLVDIDSCMNIQNHNQLQSLLQSLFQNLNQLKLKNHHLIQVIWIYSKWVMLLMLVNSNKSALANQVHLMDHMLQLILLLVNLCQHGIGVKMKELLIALIIIYF